MPAIPTHPEGFSRQVNFRITLEDWPLLEAAKREHGGIGAGIIAGLRELQRGRLEPRRSPQPSPAAAPEDPAPDPASPADPPTPRRRPRAAPASSTERPVWVPTALLAARLGVRPETVRGWINDGHGESVHGKVRADTLRVERRYAAKLLGIKSSTLGQRSEPKPDPDGLYRLGDLEQTDRELTRDTDMSPEELREIFDETGRTREDGAYVVRVVDVLHLVAGAAAPNE